MGIHYKNDKLYLVLGTRDKPITTPKGITINDDPKGAWASMSVACDDSILPAIDGIDNKIRQLLADNSEGMFGMKCTPKMIAKYKFYTPLAYSKEESSLAPLAGGKVTTTTIVEDQIGHSMMKNPAVLANLSEASPAGSKKQQGSKAYLRTPATVSQAHQQHRLVLSITRQHSHLQTCQK
ncbi:TPA: hypothetical protein ACH3X3_002766 [Trebouxia sp. C0006]